jgi:hypothetical protein
MAKNKDESWVFWLAIALSIIGVAAIIMMALRVLGVI